MVLTCILIEVLHHPLNDGDVIGFAALLKIQFQNCYLYLFRDQHDLVGQSKHLLIIESVCLLPNEHMSPAPQLSEGLELLLPATCSEFLNALESLGIGMEFAHLVSEFQLVKHPLEIRSNHLNGIIILSVVQHHALECYSRPDVLVENGVDVSSSAIQLNSPSEHDTQAQECFV